MVPTFLEKISFLAFSETYLVLHIRLGEGLGGEGWGGKGGGSEDNQMTRFEIFSLDLNLSGK